MSPQTTGLVIGGLLPALFYALAAIFSKASIRAGVGIGIYLIIAGIGVALVGIGFFAFSPDKIVSIRSAAHAFGVGVMWGVGTGLVAIGIATYGAPLGKLVPLYNINTLIAVLLALWIFSEWHQVRVPQLLIGAALMLAGGILVSRA